MQMEEGYLEFEVAEYGMLKYVQEEIGQIELRKLQDDFFVLKVFFPKLTIVNPPHEYWDDWTQIMLTNIPVNIKANEEIDGWKLKFKVIDYPIMCTMLSIWDGEHVDNNEIQITKINESQFQVDWIGCIGEDDDPNYINLKLRLKAEIREEVVTPLCLWEHELIEIFKPK